MPFKILQSINKISDNRKEAKTLILQMINGGFKNKYNNDKDIDKFLKDFELEIRNIQNKFYEIDNRFNDKTIFNETKVYYLWL